MNICDGSKLIYEDYKKLKRSLQVRNIILLIIAYLSVIFTISAGIICDSRISMIYGIYAGMIIGALVYSFFNKNWR